MHTSPFCTFHCNYFVSFCKEGVPAGTIWREKQTFLRRHLHFAPGCGKIIGRYYAAHNRKRYALVAQSVEHLTFNQRAWDSSSHERTKEKALNRRFNAFSFCLWGMRKEAAASILHIESFGQTKFIVQEETPEKSRSDQNQRMRRRTARQREEPLAKAAVGAKLLKNPKASYAAKGI